MAWRQRGKLANRRGAGAAPCPRSAPTGDRPRAGGQPQPAAELRNRGPAPTQVAAPPAPGPGLGAEEGVVRVRAAASRAGGVDEEEAEVVPGQAVGVGELPVDDGQVAEAAQQEVGVRRVAVLEHERQAGAAQRREGLERALHEIAGQIGVGRIAGGERPQRSSTSARKRTSSSSRLVRRADVRATRSSQATAGSMLPSRSRAMAAGLSGRPSIAVSTSSGCGWSVRWAMSRGTDDVSPSARRTAVRPAASRLSAAPSPARRGSLATSAGRPVSLGQDERDDVA